MDGLCARLTALHPAQTLVQGNSEEFEMVTGLELIILHKQECTGGETHNIHKKRRQSKPKQTKPDEARNEGTIETILQATIWHA